MVFHDLSIGLYLGLFSISLTFGMILYYLFFVKIREYCNRIKQKNIKKKPVYTCKENNNNDKINEETRLLINEDILDGYEEDILDGYEIV